MKKRSLVLGFAMLAFLLGRGIAGAICFQAGKVSRLRSGSVGFFVDIQHLENLSSFATFYTVGTDRFYSMLAAAQAGNEHVEVTGDAASCATTGTFRSGGNVIAVDILRNE